MEFDPYHKWLGIPPAEQPPNHYQLLSIREFESDADVIDNAAERQMAHVRKFASGPNGDASQQLLNELALARSCLLNSDKRSEYDEQLRLSSAATFSPIAQHDEQAEKPIVVTPVKNAPSYRAAIVLVVILLILVLGFLAFRSETTLVNPTDPVDGIAEWDGDRSDVVKRLNLKEEFTNRAEMKMILVSPGEFRRREQNDQGYEIVQLVRITKPYYISATEVTRQQYATATASGKADIAEIARDYPQAQTTWHEAVEFCNLLNELNSDSKLRYRLPTEAEWEFAARAGSEDDYCFGDDVSQLSDYAWFHTAGAHPVGQKKPNAWGLFDMHGNVSEWCSDWHESYDSNLAVDPTGPEDGTIRAFRGGSWFDTAGTCNLNFRGFASPRHQDRQLGIRVVAEVIDE